MTDTPTPAPLVPSQRARNLFWRKATDHPQDHSEADWIAFGFGGRYAIKGPERIPKRLGPHIKNGEEVVIDGVPHFKALLWWPEDEFTFATFDSITAAKAAANEHYQAEFAKRLDDQPHGMPRDMYERGFVPPQITDKVAEIRAERSNPGADVERLRAALDFVADEAKTANEVIRLKRYDTPQGRLKIATALHRIANVETYARISANEALATPTRAENAQVGGDGWRCFHCGDVFTEESSARKHFGPDEGSVVACMIKGGVEHGLLGALRKTEAELADAWHAIHSESTDAAKAYYAQTSRHHEQMRLAEELGYERGLADGRALTATPQAPTFPHGEGCECEECCKRFYTPDQPAENAKCSGMEERARVEQRHHDLAEAICEDFNPTIPSFDHGSAVQKIANFERDLLAALSVQSGGGR